MKNHGSSLTSVVLAVAAAVGVGIGGYCLLGGCSDGESKAAAATPVSTETDGCCSVEGAETKAVALTAEACTADTDCELKDDDCCAEGLEACCAEAQTVALEGKACTLEKAEACTAEKAEACESKTTECESKETAEVTETAIGNG